MKRLLIILAFSFSILDLSSQEVINLDNCVAHAYKKYEFDKISQSYSQSAELAQKNVTNNWYPKLTLDGTFTYQNENISIPVAFPIAGFEAPVAPLNINRLVVNINQTIYDGSVSSSLKKVESAKNETNQKQVEIDKIQVRTRVTQLFVTANLMDANVQLLEDKKEVVESRLSVLRAAQKSGAISTVNVKLLEAELMQLNQIIFESQYGVKSAKSSLSEYTGLKISENTVLEMPNPQVTFTDDVSQRAELKLFDVQMSSLEAQSGLVGTNRLPKVGFFATVGAGNPGYDIFKENISPMAMVGLNFQWSIWDWNKTKNQKQVFTINQEVLQFKKNQATTQFESELMVQKLEIEKMNQLLINDQEVIKMREEITLIRSLELESGSITTTQYLDELNKENEAKLNYKMHELKLGLAKLNYLIIQGL